MKLKRTKFDTAADVLCIVCIVGLIIYLTAGWNSFPYEIAGHYNAAGQPDRMGSRAELIVIPVMVVIIYALLAVVGCFPQIWNTGVKVTEENRERVYRTLMHMLSVLKIEMVVSFVYISVSSSLQRPLPAAFMPIFLLLMFGTIGLSIFKLFKVK